MFIYFGFHLFCYFCSLSLTILSILHCCSTDSLKDCVMCVVLQIKNWAAEELMACSVFPQLTSSKKGVQMPGLSDFKTCALTHYTRESVGDQICILLPTLYFPQVRLRVGPNEASSFYSVLTRREHATQQEATWREGREGAGSQTDQPVFNLGSTT